MKKSFCLLVGLYSLFSFGSNCPTISYLENAEDAQMIFIGKVNDVSEIEVEFKIFEVFKGKEIDSITVLIPNSFEKLMLEELWLVYLYRSANGQLVLERCGGAKNFKMPMESSNIYFPDPPLIDLDEKSYALWMHVNQLKLLADFQIELSYLGRKKWNWQSKATPDTLSKEISIIKYSVFLVIALLMILITMKSWLALSPEK